MKIAIFITSLFGMVSLIAAIWAGFGEFEDKTITASVVSSIKNFITNLFKNESINKIMNTRFVVARMCLALVFIFGLVTIILNLVK